MRMTMAGRQHQQHDDDDDDDVDPGYPSLIATNTTTKNNVHAPSSAGDDDDDDDDDKTSSSTTSIDRQQEALCEMLGLPLSFTALTLQEDENDDDADGDGDGDDDDAETCALVPSSTNKNGRGKRNGVDDDDENENENETVAAAARMKPISWIHLPPKASRYLYPPSQCTAFCIPQLFTPQQCRHWIDLATTSRAGAGGGAGGARINNKQPTEQLQQQQQQQQQRGGGFQYITHATHTTPDGSTSFLVQLQNPNPHKLSVFHHAPSVDLIWNRLRQHLVCCLPTSSSDSILQKLLDREACGEPVALNPRLRVLKYDAADGDEFQPHFDATTRIRGGVGDEPHISLLTVLIYLATGDGVDFAGGDTLFLNHTDDDGLHVTTTSSSRGATCSNNNDTDTSSTGVAAITPTVGSAVIFEHDLYHASTPLQWGTKYVLRTDIMFRLVQDPQEKQFQKQQQQRQQRQQQPEEEASSEAATAARTTVDSSTCIMTTPTFCCCSTMAQLCEKLQLSSKDKDALEELGMLGLSLDAFCGPGKFILYQILQSVDISTPACRALIEGAFAEKQKRVD